MKKNNAKNYLIVFLTLIVALASINFYNSKQGNKIQENPTDFSYIEFQELLKNEKIETVYLNYDDEKFKFSYFESKELKEKSLNETRLEGFSINPRTTGFKGELLSSGINVKEVHDVNILNLLAKLLPIVLTIVMIIYLSSFLKSGNGGALSIVSKKVGKQVKSTYKLKDVIGSEVLKEDIETIIKGLKNPVLFEKAGAKLPKGILLFGPPGTGKTLLAKAIAGEAGVPFFSASGSEFIEMYVGVGASRIRELFESAKKAAPAIIYIDEIDAIASRKSDDRNSEAKQTINQLLTEMGGFESSSGVVVIASTNASPNELEPALMREGRFDKKVCVDLPSKESRLKILKLHSKDKKFSEDVNFKLIADSTYGFSGASLETLLNSGAINAVKQDRSIINKSDLDSAFFEIIMQGTPEKHKKQVTKEITAWHEAGHTIVHKLMRGLPVSNVTIVGSSSGAGGVTFPQQKEDEYTTRQDILDEICVDYAGRVAEEKYFNGDITKITTGASSDINNATKRIEKYIVAFGLGNKYGMLNIGSLQNIPTDNNELIEEAIKLSNELYDRTKNFINENFDKLEIIAKALIEKETLNDDELNELLAIEKEHIGQKPTITPLEDTESLKKKDVLKDIFSSPKNKENA